LICTAIPLNNPQGFSATWCGHDLSQVIEQIPIGMPVTLPHGVTEYANPHLRQRLGLSVERVLAANLAQFRSEMRII